MGLLHKIYKIFDFVASQLLSYWFKYFDHPLWKNEIGKSQQIWDCTLWDVWLLYFWEALKSKITIGTLKSAKIKRATRSQTILWHKGRSK